VVASVKLVGKFGPGVRTRYGSGTGLAIVGPRGKGPRGVAYAAGCNSPVMAMSVAGSRSQLQRVTVRFTASAGHPAGPVQALGPRVRCSPAIDVDDADLAVASPVVVPQQPLKRQGSGRTRMKVGQGRRPCRRR